MRQPDAIVLSTWLNNTLVEHCMILPACTEQGALCTEQWSRWLNKMSWLSELCSSFWSQMLTGVRSGTDAQCADVRFLPAADVHPSRASSWLYQMLCQMIGVTPGQQGPNVSASPGLYLWLPLLRTWTVQEPVKRQMSLLWIIWERQRGLKMTTDYVRTLTDIKHWD